MIKSSTRQKIESNQEDILSYYQSHCLRVTASHFHISPTALESWLTEKKKSIKILYSSC